VNSRVSAGILLYRFEDGRLEVLLGHPGGPWARAKDAGHWSIPKGEVDVDGEDLLEVARREFAEETGHPVPPGAILRPLGDTRQKGGKLVHAWAAEGDLDPAAATSNTFEMEWPPGSGQRVAFPEFDRVEWFSAAEGRIRLKEAQGVFIDRLEAVLGSWRPTPGYHALMQPTFADLQPAPPDSILGLTEQFKVDARSHKISLASGVYVDESGITPVLESVSAAERRILEAQTTKLYKPIAGDPAYTDAVRALIFGTDHAALAAGRVETLHTPGGTGALRVAADLIRRLRPASTVWLSSPTWPNHPHVFEAAGLSTRAYPYLDAGASGLDLPGMLDALAKGRPGDVVVLHACCHNPSGVDPSPSQWAAIAELVDERGLWPLLDFAYQGFGDGLREDAVGLLAVAARSRGMLVASSFSKNFSLYNERVGALSIVADSPSEASVLLSHAKAVVRSNYSNPPAHGGEIVATILLDHGLRERWEAEVTVMRERIGDNRRRFVAALLAAGVALDPAPLLRERGMFSLLGMTAEQVDRLKREHGVYVVGHGRVNVAGLTSTNIGPACAAIAAVIDRRRDP